MAARNPHRGQLGIEVGDLALTFAFTTNALCEVEEAFGLDDITQIERVLGDKPSLRTIRTLFRIGLTDCQPGMTDQQAGTIMEEVGGLEPSLELILRAINVAFPDAEAKPGNGGANPPVPAKAGPGTGRRSPSTGVRRSGARSNTGG
ncbi:hypothetical protein ASG37_04920 [Sphingomonas sp. Leaf407]|uniref:hypothetical protein n=1 Tax=unclassified Sphingomonas TaxID=196159 RepID=UPI00070225E7|nr:MULTISPECIES: hypothetical protein [unclassified Sphingomonas]KQN37176.1 hypothetical protein ASE97_10835 [Sphingomonas sp. Leaf42]KQT30824.1 hypothetical protein ASG37_04920 [Sphingomonas sp. Leaf407]